MLLCVFLLQQVFSQDQLIFDNGDVVSGTYLGKTESLIYFESLYFGTLKISSNRVQVKLMTEPDKAGSAAFGNGGNPVELISEKLHDKSSVALDFPEVRPPGGLGLLWETTERTLNRFVHDRVPDWFPQLPENWKGDVTLGFNLNEAVKTSTRYFGEFGLEGDQDRTHYKFGSYFAYAEQEDIQSENDWGLSARFRYKLKNTDFFETLTTHDIDNLYDPAKRSTVSLGFGLKPYKRDNLTFDYVVGGAVEWVNRRNGVGETNLKINVNENFNWKFNEHLTLKQSLRFYLDPSNDMHYNFRFETGLQTLIVGAFNLGLFYRLDYDSAIENMDNRQKRKIVTSLGVKF